MPGLEDKRPQPSNPEEALRSRIRRLEREIAQIRQTGPSYLQTIDVEEYIDPGQGETHVNWPGMHMLATEHHPVVYYHDQEWKGLGGPYPAVLFIKVVTDQKPVIAGDKRFQFKMGDYDMDGMELIHCEAYVTTAGTNVIQIHRVDDGDLLSTPIHINGGLNSTASSPQPVIAPHSPISSEEHIRIDVDTAGGMGLGVMLTFYFPPLVFP